MLSTLITIQVVNFFTESQPSSSSIQNAAAFASTQEALLIANSYWDM
jgi:hypothetical protein